MSSVIVDPHGNPAIPFMTDNVDGWEDQESDYADAFEPALWLIMEKQDIRMDPTLSKEEQLSNRDIGILSHSFWKWTIHVKWSTRSVRAGAVAWAILPEHPADNRPAMATTRSGSTSRTQGARSSCRRCIRRIHARNAGHTTGSPIRSRSSNSNVTPPNISRWPPVTTFMPQICA